MEVVESCILPLVFAPVDHVFQATVRVDVDFPYVVVLETAVFTEHRGASSACNRGKGSAQCLSPAEPFISHHFNLASVEDYIAPVWEFKAAEYCPEGTETGTPGGASEGNPLAAMLETLNGSSEEDISHGCKLPPSEDSNQCG